MSDIALIVTITTGCCAVVGLLGLVTVRLLGRRSLRVTVVVATLVPVLAVAVSVLVNVNQMFLSRHDSGVVLVALGCATVIAVALTVVVGHSVAAGAQAVRASLQHLGTAGEDSPIDEAVAARFGSGERAPAELALLAAELETVRQRLVGARRRERALERSRRELVSFMSHDLRTPLTGLRALAEGLEDGVLDDVPAATARIRGAVDRMTLLVDDLFELSRVTAGAPRRPRRLVSLAELALDVATDACDHARVAGVDLRVDLPAPADRLPVLGDADELARALTNLVTNAVRHTARGGAVHLVGDRGPQGQVRMAVVDGCGGIPAADLAHVFDAGWRGRPDRTPDDGGAGLGLAIARGVVEAHAGLIAVENVAGGCRFVLALPRPSAGPAATPLANPAPAPPRVTLPTSEG